MSDPYSGTLHFYHSLLKISLYQEFCPLWECLFSYRYPSFNFSVTFDISCNNIPYSYSRICSYYYTISFHPVYFDSSLLSSAYLQCLSIFDKYFHSMFIQTLLNVFVIVFSVDLWILAIVAWSSTHRQISMP